MSSFPLIRIIGFVPRQHGGTFSSKLPPCVQTHLKGRNQLVNFKFTNATGTIQKSGFTIIFMYMTYSAWSSVSVLWNLIKDETFVIFLSSAVLHFLQPMSATLRERLRKTRRSFNANFTVAKRLKIDSEEKDCADVDTEHLPQKSADCSRLQDGSESLEGNCTGHTCFKSPSQENSLCESGENGVRVDLSHQQSLEEKVRLVKQVQEKEELLRRLKLVKMYRSKVRRTSEKALINHALKWNGVKSSFIDLSYNTKPFSLRDICVLSQF